MAVRNVQLADPDGVEILSSMIAHDLVRTDNSAV